MTRIFISVLLLIFLCGCHITNSDNQITEVIEVYPKGLDPARNLGYFENRLINAIYEPLVRLDSDYQTVLPGLAEKWEVSEDSKTFRFHLKKKIYFP